MATRAAAALPLVAIFTFAPRSVTASVELFREETVAPESIQSWPPLPTPTPSA